jgi:hypothetical protein
VREEVRSERVGEGIGVRGGGVGSLVVCVYQ